MSLKFQKGDHAAIGLVILLAAAVLLLFLPGKSTGPALVEIYLDGVLVKTVSLSAEESCTLTGAYTNTVTVSGGSVTITHSDCPGRDCVHSGSISQTGRSLVCLPNKLEVRVVGNNGDVDFVVG